MSWILTKRISRDRWVTGSYGRPDQLIWRAPVRQVLGEGVIEVMYLIDFSQLKRPAAFSFGGLQANSGIAVVDDYSKLPLVAPTGKTATITITINQAVAVEGDFVAKQDTTKSAGIQKAANIASGVIGGLIGSAGLVDSAG